MAYTRLTPLFLAPALIASAFAAPTLPGIGSAMQQMIDRHEIAGAVTIVLNKDHTLHLECTGQADLATGRPITPDTLF